MLNSNSLIGLSPQLRAILADTGISELPPIRGSWFIVDPYKVTESAGGIEGALFSIEDAYAACVSGRGDGILVLSGGTTATHTSSALKAPITWSKHAITVFGVAAGGYNSRARIVSHSATSTGTFAINATAQTITRTTGSFVTDGWAVGMTGIVDNTDTNANVSFTVTAVSALVLTGTVGTDSLLLDASAGNTLTGYFPALITVSGSNNIFHNLYFINEANHAYNVGAVHVSGNRNLFTNCHFNTVSALASAAAGLYDMKISSSECFFYNCWFGNNNVLRSAANGNISLGNSTTQIGQNYFTDCYILSTSETAGHGGIIVVNAATLGGYVQFKRCSFVNWASGAKTALTTCIIGETPNNCGILLQDCAMVGWAAWGANNDMWFTSNAAGAAGTGGIAGQIA